MWRNVVANGCPVNRFIKSLKERGPGSVTLGSGGLLSWGPLFWSLGVRPPKGRLRRRPNTLRKERSRPLRSQGLDQTAIICKKRREFNLIKPAIRYRMQMREPEGKGEPKGPMPPTYPPYPFPPPTMTPGITYGNRFIFNLISSLIACSN